MLALESIVAEALKPLAAHVLKQLAEEVAVSKTVLEDTLECLQGLKRDSQAVIATVKVILGKDCFQRKNSSLVAWMLFVP